jgi:hypothetical protein
LRSADFLRQLAALRIRPDIAPDQCRTHDLVPLVEHDRAVHLPGEADTGNVLRPKARVCQGLRNRDATGPPPVFRLLFGPSDLRGGKRRVFFGCGRDHVALFVQDQCARAARTHINAK